MAYRGQTIIENEDAYNAAIARRIQANRIKGSQPWRDDHVALIAFIERKAESGVVFWKDMNDNITKWGKLTDNQAAACERIMKEDADKMSTRKAEYAARDAGSVYIGALKGRQEHVVTLRHVVEMDTQFGRSYLHLMNDDKGNVCVCKSGSRLGHYIQEEYTDYRWNLEGEIKTREKFIMLEKGETATIIASVKKWEERNGVKQTVLQRAVVKVAK